MHGRNPGHCQRKQTILLQRSAAFSAEFNVFSPPPQINVQHDISGTTLAISSAVATRDGMLRWGGRHSLNAIEIDKELQMLVLSRKVGERIHVGENIVLEIRRIAGNRVTLALDAPRNVRILRGELEHAAKEFREPEHAETQPPVFENGTPANVAILQTLSTDPLSRHCVS